MGFGFVLMLAGTRPIASLSLPGGAAVTFATSISDTAEALTKRVTNLEETNKKLAGHVELLLKRLRSQRKA
jgi:hypothetical protein